MALQIKSIEGTEQLGKVLRKGTRVSEDGVSRNVDSG